MGDSRPYYPSPYAHGMPSYATHVGGGGGPAQQPVPATMTSPNGIGSSVVPSYFNSPAPPPARAQSNCSTGSARKRVRTSTANEYSGDERDSPAASSAKGGMRVGLNVKTRIHRACNACRKQKMRCEGPVNAPCNRCAAADIACVFEKPARDPAPSIMGGTAGEAEGLERLRTLESKMEAMQSTLTELVYALRESQSQSRWDGGGGSVGVGVGSHRQHSGPTLPALSFPPRRDSLGRETMQDHWRSSGAAWSPPLTIASSRVGHARSEAAMGHARSEAAVDGHARSEAAMDNRLARPWEPASAPSSHVGPLQSPSEQPWSAVVPDVSRMPPPLLRPLLTPHKRARSAMDEYEVADLPAHSLHTPIAALRGLADAAVAVSNASSSEGREPGSASTKDGFEASTLDEPGANVVQRGLVAADEALRLWRLFGRGCGRFFNIFEEEDAEEDDHQRFASVRDRSAFLFDSILTVGARVECAGGAPSRAYKVCLAAAQRHAGKTLSGHVNGREDVQALLLLASYCDNGRLAVAHAIRAAQQLGLDKAIDELVSLLGPTLVPGLGVTSQQQAAQAQAWQSIAPAQIHELLSKARVWAFAYVLERQLNFGADQRCLLPRDSAQRFGDFLQLGRSYTLLSDVRLVSMLELINSCMRQRDSLEASFQAGDFERSVSAFESSVMQWEQYWDSQLEQRHFEEAGFHRQSLRLQSAAAKLYLVYPTMCNLTHGSRGGNEAQLKAALQAIKMAQTTLCIAVDCEEYFEQLRWAPLYAHLAASIACAFLFVAIDQGQLYIDVAAAFARTEKLALRLRETAAVKHGDAITRVQWHTWKRLAAANRSQGITLMYGAKALERGALTAADLDRGTMSAADYEELLKLLVERSSSSPSRHPSSSVRSSSGDAGVEVGKASSIPWLSPTSANARQAPLQLPAWAQSITSVDESSSAALEASDAKSFFNQLVAELGFQRTLD